MQYEVCGLLLISSIFLISYSSLFYASLSSSFFCCSFQLSFMLFHFSHPPSLHSFSKCKIFSISLSLLQSLTHRIMELQNSWSWKRTVEKSLKKKFQCLNNWCIAGWQRRSGKHVLGLQTEFGNQKYFQRQYRIWQRMDEPPHTLQVQASSSPVARDVYMTDMIRDRFSMTFSSIGRKD